jgi:uncharacterized protein YqhQ
MKGRARPPAAYGGQAVIEGVMMRGAAACATAVRAPDGTIRFDVHSLDAASRRRLGRIPLVRGLFVLVDTLSLGFRSLAFSASVQAGPEENIGGAPMAASMVGAVLAGVALFFLLPAAAAFAVERALNLAPALSVAIEGLIRLALLLGYLWAIGRIPEIRRVYAYHGAEHKTIHAYEAHRPLLVEEVAPFPREHPRCGTAFLLTVVVFSIIFFSLLGPMPLGLRLVSRLLLIPVLAGVAYEYIRWTARFEHARWAKPLLAPNLALQRLTTREPEVDMIEVAIAAFEAMRRAESEQAVDTLS